MTAGQQEGFTEEKQGLRNYGRKACVPKIHVEIPTPQCDGVRRVGGGGDSVLPARMLLLSK